ncbi:MAG: xanthine dehydrogenase family protein molybdopterin-binding subunit [Eubacteriales bacterium]
MSTNGYKYLNRSIKRVDAFDKVTGRAQYTDDLRFDGMLYGGALYSPYASAKVTCINTQKAKAVQGVRAVVTFADLPKMVSWSTYRYLTDVIRFYGDAVAMVAAESREALEEALAAIEVEYEKLPSVFTIEEALEEGAHQVREEWPGNIHKASCFKVRKGDTDAAFAACDLVVEREYRTHYVEHAYMETESAIAVPKVGSTEMVVYAGCVNPFFTRHWVADALGLPRSRVQGVQQILGGSFGGKEELMGQVACRAAILAKTTGRPVKMTVSREESIAGSTKRHPMRLRYKVGVNRDGKLQALTCEIAENLGAYSMHQFMNFRASVHAPGVYNIPNVQVDVFGVFTNNVTSGAMRGYSAPQIIFAQEQLYEEIAEELGMDFIDFKRMNMLRQGDTTPTGQLLDGEVILEKVMDSVLEKSAFQEKRDANARAEGIMRKGIGLAVCYRGCGLGAESADASGAIVTVHDDGTIMINVGLSENGQGLKTTFTQIVAETMGISPDLINCIGVDTNTIADGGITAASRSTSVGSIALKKAAEELKGHLIQTVAEMMFHCPPDMIELVDGFFCLKGVPDAMIPFPDVCAAHYWTGHQSTVYCWNRPAELGYDHEKGCGKAFPNYTYSAVVAEVEVDTQTGLVDVLKVYSAHDVGTVVNPEMAAGQVYGGVAMGMGFALMEELDIHKGKIQNNNFNSYIMPTSLDVPQVEPAFFESDNPEGTFGTKSLGEPATEAVAAAIANAVRNATGYRFHELPANLEMVLLHKHLTRGGKFL